MSLLSRISRFRCQTRLGVGTNPPQERLALVKPNDKRWQTNGRRIGSEDEPMPAYGKSRRPVRNERRQACDYASVVAGQLIEA